MPSKYIMPTSFESSNKNLFLQKEKLTEPTSPGESFPGYYYLSRGALQPRKARTHTHTHRENRNVACKSLPSLDTQTTRAPERCEGREGERAQPTGTEDRRYY